MAPASLVKQATLQGSTLGAQLGIDPMMGRLIACWMEPLWAGATAKLLGQQGVIWPEARLDGSLEGSHKWGN